MQNSRQRPIEEVIDVRPLSQREAQLVEQAKSLALNIEQNNKHSLQYYFELGKIVGETSLSHHQLAARIGRRGFGHATLSDALLFHTYVQKNHRGHVDQFIAAMENDPQYLDFSVSWRHARDYIRRDRRASSRGEVEADQEFDRKEATVVETEFREFEQQSRKLLTKWENLSQNTKSALRHYLKVPHRNLKVMLELEPAE